MRRRLRAALLLVSLAAMLLLTGTALATEGGADATDPDEGSGAFGEGDWDGLLVTAGVAVMLGTGIFFLSGGHRSAGSSHEDAHH